MKIYILLLIFPFILNAQPAKEFNIAFNKSRELLYYGKFKEAIPVLLRMDSMDRSNPNVHYLLGVSYIASGEDLDKGIDRLLFASAYVTNAYRSGQAAERNAPIYNWYYLGVGYAFKEECEKAEECFKKFKSFISDPGDSYVADADSKITSCRGSEKKVVIETPVSSQPAGDPSAQLELSANPEENVSAVNTVTILPDKARGQMKTRTVIFTTKSPLYAVQVGAFDKLLPSNDFRNLKNVHSFIDKNGKVRYVVGNCVMRSQAENLRKAVVEAGYKDAFIVDINTEEKFTEEVLHPFKPVGRKEYRVQLGVFRNEIPEDLSRIYLKIDGIKETHEGELTVLTSGSFKDHESALQYRNQMISMGVPGAFVVVFVNGKRQTLAQMSN